MSHVSSSASQSSQSVSQSHIHHGRVESMRPVNRKQSEDPQHWVEIENDEGIPGRRAHNPWPWPYAAHTQQHLAAGALIAVRVDHVGTPLARPSMGPFFSSKRRVLAYVASFRPEEVKRPFAQGSFRFAAKGTFVGGPGDASGVADAVGKWFKTKSMQSDEKYALMDLKASQKAVELVSAWNDLASSDRHFFKRIDDLRPACARPASMLQVVEPQLWKWAPGSKLAGQSLMIEPFLPYFEKWNSNSGWQSDSSWGQVMAALSHFSYHVTGGELLLCDLQGGVSDRAGCVLTDPVICSRERSYGLTDLGPEGMSLWFKHHKCTRHCYASWMKPPVQHNQEQKKASANPRFEPYFVMKSTTMRPV